MVLKSRRFNLVTDVDSRCIQAAMSGESADEESKRRRGASKLQLPAAGHNVVLAPKGNNNILTPPANLA